ncbi:hypothetical protein AB205_0077670 [Aquarana catesbeiana]|uniref:Uncharacterized protein n=1 Tax=Aquarana catesbeiana TaxID=8400 RepID=A0A2G9PP11_AQUCT|nr:hypothetical protein AB205_0077670 [Aquarana catesbeiana]
MCVATFPVTRTLKLMLLQQNSVNGPYCALCSIVHCSATDFAKYFDAYVTLLLILIAWQTLHFHIYSFFSFFYPKVLSSEWSIDNVSVHEADGFNAESFGGEFVYLRNSLLDGISLNELEIQLVSQLLEELYLQKEESGALSEEVT